MRKHTVTPGSARSMLLPKLESLLDILGIKWIEPRAYYKSTGTTFRSYAQGMYHSQIDAISVRAQGATNRSANYVFLHEIAHATGHASRLDRECFKAEYQTKEEYDTALHTEEATAELGAYYLAIAFDLDKASATAYLDNYLQLLPHADLDKARIDGRKAADYVLLKLE